MAGENKSRKLVDIIRDVVSRDKELRQKYQIGEKFRFIKDRLNALLERLEKSEQESVAEEKKIEAEHHGHILVYVYLYNAHGLSLKSWQKMVTPNILYEHSVNRPIYLEKNHIEAYLRSKTNKAHHGFLTIRVKEEDIINRDGQKDSIGQPLIKIKEGSLVFKHLVSFSHGGNEYTVTEEGEIIKAS